MLRKLVTWVKNNKLTTVLIVIVVYFLYRNFGISPLMFSRQVTPKTAEFGATPDVSYGKATSIGLISPDIFPPAMNEAPPTIDVDQRLVVRESNMSLLVGDVRQTTDEILSFTEKQGGYMVSSSLNQPEEAPFATIVLRVPSDRFRETLEYFRSLAIKVTSENILGMDVTDEYEDIKAKIETLEKTKKRFEEIMDQAVKIDDILRVQREIINLQSQIDSLKGRQQYLEQTAKLSRITVYLSTDEIALPYAPTDTFRPAVIFKLAVRSLIRVLRKIATAVIWIAVYSVVWIPIGLIILFFKRRKAKRAETQKTP